MLHSTKTLFPANISQFSLIIDQIIQIFWKIYTFRNAAKYVYPSYYLWPQTFVSKTYERKVRSGHFRPSMTGEILFFAHTASTAFWILLNGPNTIYSQPIIRWSFLLHISCSLMWSMTLSALLCLNSFKTREGLNMSFIGWLHVIYWLIVSCFPIIFVSTIILNCRRLFTTQNWFLPAPPRWIRTKLLLKGFPEQNLIDQTIVWISSTTSLYTVKLVFNRLKCIIKYFYPLLLDFQLNFLLQAKIQALSIPLQLQRDSQKPLHGFESTTPSPHFPCQNPNLIIFSHIFQYYSSDAHWNISFHSTNKSSPLSFSSCWRRLWFIFTVNGPLFIVQFRLCNTQITYPRFFNLLSFLHNID